MENNLFSEHQIEFMYSNPMFFRFVNDYFSSFSIQSSNFGMRMKNTDEMSESDMHIYIRIILANLAELRQMISEIEKSLSYTYKDSVQTFDGEIHGHLQVQKYLRLKTQVKYPKEYPCQIKKRTSVTPENIFLIYIVDYVIRLLDFFAKVLRNYIGNTYSTEKTLIDEYRRAFHAFSRKNYFRECAVALENIRKQYGDEFPANFLNLIKIRAAKGKIRNYQSYEKIFDWYWKYKQGTIEFDLLKTLRILRYSDDFCNRLFELWCLYSIKETFIKEFGMTLISERNIMDVGNQSVFTLKTTNDGIVEIFYQKGAKLYWDEEAEPVWKYIDSEGKKKRLVGIPDISVKYSARTNSLVMIDLKNRIRTAGSNSEEIYKMIGYFSNFDNMFKRIYSEGIGELAEELPKQMELLRQNYFPHIWNNMSEKTKEILAMADCLFSGMRECESADYAPICLEYCRGLEVQLNQLIFEPFRNSHNISNLVRRNRFYDKMQETREMTLGECVFFLEKCIHRNYPMIELKQYIDNIVHDSNIFFSVAVPIMKEINVNIRRLSAHTTIMTYDELVSTRQKILGIGYLNLFYQLLDQR